MKKFTTDTTKQLSRSPLFKTQVRLAPHTYTKPLSTKPPATSLPLTLNRGFVTENHEEAKDHNKDKLEQSSNSKSQSSAGYEIPWSLFKIAFWVTAFQQFVEQEIIDWQKGYIIEKIKELPRGMRDHRHQGTEMEDDRLEQAWQNFIMLYEGIPNISLNYEEKIELLRLMEVLLPQYFLPLKIYIGNALSAYHIIKEQHSKAQEISQKNIELVEGILATKLGSNNRIKILNGLSELNCEVSVLYYELKQIDPALPTVIAQALYYIGKAGINKVTEESRQQLQLAIKLREEIDKDLNATKQDYYSNHLASDSIIFKTLGTITYDIRRDDIKEDISVEHLEETIKEVESLIGSINLRNQQDCKAKKIQLHCLIVRKLTDSNIPENQEKRNQHLMAVNKNFEERYHDKNYDQIFEELKAGRPEVRTAKNFNYIGEVALLRGDIVPARKFYQEAITIENSSRSNDHKVGFPLSDAHLAMTEICIREGKLEEAIDHLEKHKQIQKQKGELVPKRAERFEERIRQPNTIIEPNSSKSLSDSCIVL